MFDKITKQENKLKSQLVKEFKKLGDSYFVQQHQDVRKQGIPDLSVTGFGKTTWLELKHATPASKRKGAVFSTHKNQEWTCHRLQETGTCFYVVYFIIDPKTIGTYVALPSNVFGKDGRANTIEAVGEWEGYNHEGVVKFVHDLHREYK